MKMLTKSKTARSPAMLPYIIVSIAFILAAIYIVFQLFSTKYPTHSDVFWTGVQCGILGVLSIIFMVYGMFFLYRAITKKKILCDH